MKKRMLLLLLCVSAVLVLLGCGEGTGTSSSVSSSASAEISSTAISSEDISGTQVSSSTYSTLYEVARKPEDESVVNNWLSKRIDIEDINAGDYADIITKVFSPDDIDGVSLLTSKWFYYYYSSMQYTTPIDEDEFECYRTADNNVIYTIIKLDNGTLVYTYYTCSGDDFIPSYAVAVSKKLSSEAFNDITVGSKLDEIYKIEPAANIGNYTGSSNLFKSDDVQTDNVNQVTIPKVLLLTDGLLELRYEVTEGGECIITEKILHSDFKCTYVISAEDSIAGEYDYTILEKDYPKN